MHRGIYVDDPSESGPESPSATLQEQVERLLVEKSVDLVLNGHTRVYHQSCPIIQGHCVGYSTDGTAKGPVHVMLGIGGAAIPLRANAAVPFWVVEESFEHGVAQLVADKTSLTLQVRFGGGVGRGFTSRPLIHSLACSLNVTHSMSITHSLTQCHSLAHWHSLAHVIDTHTHKHTAVLAAVHSPQVMSSRTGQEVSSFTLTKPAAWKPDPTAAAQRFATLQKATPKQPAVQSALAALSSEASSSEAPDFDGLTQLLQEDLLAAAASTPSVLDKFAGRNSYLSKVVDALADGEAPAPVSSSSSRVRSAGCVIRLYLLLLSKTAAVPQTL